MALVLTEELTEALAHLRSGHHLFLTGKAGTGKSTLVRHFMASTDRNVVVVAPTGIAALNVDGYTIHRLFSFATTTTIETVRGPDYYPGRFATTLRALDTLVIDEASMVRADVFDMLVAALERFGPKPGTPFGGVQIVLVGDLFQLPPVVVGAEAEYLAARYETPYFFSTDAFDRERFPTVALTHVFRQQGDDRLTSILNAIREGVLVDQAREDLNARTDPDFVPPDDELWLTLAPTNRLVTARNRARLARLPGEEVVSRARRTGDLTTFDAPVEDALTFKVGAQVMMLANDPADRWVNGTLARVAWVDDEEGPDAVVVGVELADGTVETVHPVTWDATRPVVEGGTLRRDVVGTFTQLPFKLAWAVTIHKAQGQTLDRLVVDLTGGVFDYGQVYVALSRCTSMSGLVLTRPVLAKDLKTDRRVLRFLRAATSSGPARHCAVGVLTVGDEGLRSRPRPVEIAVAFDDGSAVSTLVNPHRDLGSARSEYGITVDDVLLAPSLPEAWSVLGPLLDGCTPVGVGTDLALGIIDFELKRLGRVEPLPLGVELPAAGLLPSERAGLAAPSALERARASLAVHRRTGGDDDGAGAFAAPEAAASGYLLTRDPDASPPTTALTPTLAAVLTASRAMSEVVLQGVRAAEVRARFDADWSSSGAAFAAPEGVPSSSGEGDAPSSGGGDAASSALDDPVLREVVAARLASAVERSAGLPPVLLDRVREVEDLLDTSILGPGLAAGGSVAHASLVPEARVCFTGTVHDPTGRFVDKGELERLVTSHGLRWAPTVSKTRCDVLVVAELGTQSGKARKAKEYGKPVISAAEFYDWVASRP